MNSITQPQRHEESFSSVGCVPAFGDQGIQADLNYDNLEAMKAALPAKRKRNPESKLQKQIIAWLEAHGCVAIRVNSGMLKIKDRFIRCNSASGCSDIIACVPGPENVVCNYGTGIFVAIEVKVGRNLSSSKQNHFIDRIRSAGGIAIVARSISDVENALPWLINS